MENNQEYFKHLSETHFFTNLWGRFNKAEGPQRKTCPVKDCKKGFSTENKQEAAIHLGNSMILNGKILTKAFLRHKGGGALLRLRETNFEAFVLVLKIGLGG